MTWAHLYGPNFGSVAAYVCVTQQRCRWRLATTRDEGRHWHDITPPGPAKVHPFASGRGPNDFEPFFLDPSHVWVATVNCGRGRGRIYRSTDGGETWRSTSGPSASCSQGTVVPDFVDPTHGWLAVLQPTGPGASLEGTSDGGATWQHVHGHTVIGGLPLVAPVTFTTTTDGWDGGGVFSWGRLYSTNDGGHTWNLAFGSRTSTTPRVIPDVPTTLGDTLILPLTVRHQGHHYLVRFERSTDGGASWAQVGEARIVGTLPASSPAFGNLPRPLPTVITNANDWWVAAGSFVYRTTDAGAGWSVHRLPTPTPTSISASDPMTAWVTSSRSLFLTHDGGKTWRKVPTGTWHPPGASVIRARPMTACPKEVLSPGPAGTPLPDRAIGERARATGAVVFGLADEPPLFGVVYPAISTDGGQTWRVDGPCFYFAAAQAPNGVSDIGARAPDWAYAWGRGAQAVKVTHDGGGHWFVSFLPPIQKIVASGDTLRAFLWHSTSTYISRDYGLTWSLYQPGL